MIYRNFFFFHFESGGAGFCCRKNVPNLVLLPFFKVDYWSYGLDEVTKGWFRDTYGQGFE